MFLRMRILFFRLWLGWPLGFRPRLRGWALLWRRPFLRGWMGLRHWPLLRGWMYLLCGSGGRDRLFLRSWVDLRSRPHLLGWPLRLSLMHLLSRWRLLDRALLWSLRCRSCPWYGSCALTWL